ncbi:macrolide family glycosyltransferase [Eisenbergiella porci]|uniref:macrolide family glycosyltransferase n=1 Tax=Eisenbergiella porci TaxID=2652274 RepID=UPI002A82A035|nr:macrolide family glycosyltransferase [Eisenbergiella porci]
MYRIAFFCIPAYGHTNPTLEVVRELVRRGNEIRYYSYNMMKEKIEATGAKFISCDQFDPQMDLRPEDAERISTDIAFSTKLLVNMTLTMDEALLDEMTQWKPDCIVADSMAMWGKLVAYKLGVPFMSSTTTFAFNRYSSKVMKQSFSQLFKMLFSIPKANRQLSRLKQRGYPVKNVLSVVQNDNDTNTIVYTSPEFQPCAETFSDKYTFVGPSIQASEAVTSKTGRPTIFISMGTIVNSKPDFYRNCIKAFANSAYDVVMSVGKETDLHSLGPIPDNFTVAQSVNQIEELQKADVFLTHCGMNSVNEALYYKVPLVLFPQTTEQGGVAYRAKELGAGTYLMDDAPESIKNSVLHVLENDAFRHAAETISEGFHHCGGFVLAADKIEALCH